MRHHDIDIVGLSEDYKTGAVANCVAYCYIYFSCGSESDRKSAVSDAWKRFLDRMDEIDQFLN